MGVIAFNGHDNLNFAKTTKKIDKNVGMTGLALVSQYHLSLSSYSSAFTASKNPRNSIDFCRELRKLYAIITDNADLLLMQR